MLLLPVHELLELLQVPAKRGSPLKPKASLSFLHTVVSLQAQTISTEALGTNPRSGMGMVKYA